MEPKSVYTLLKYCSDRSIREKVWNHWTSKASFKNEFYNNSVILEEIRHNKLFFFIKIIFFNYFSEGLAKALGYSSISDRHLTNKMAGSSQTVRNFLTA